MKITNKDRILVTGGCGFLGKFVVKVLEETFPDSDLKIFKKTLIDLRNIDRCKEAVSYFQPTVVVNLAGKVGGILANKKYPYNFLTENLRINLNIFDVVGEGKTTVKKLVNVIGGCSYPGNAESPIKESQMWEGYPQEESAPYAMAKKMILVMSKACKDQYGFNSVTLIPGNIYGPYDDFSEYGHVIPSLINRMVISKVTKEVFYAYGTGEVVRDFVYVEDVAKCFPFFIENYESTGPVNISSGKGVRIKDLVEMIADIIGFNRECIRWDTLKPDGMKIKVFDIAKMRALGLSCNTDLREGLEKTIKDYKTKFMITGKGG